MSRRKTGRTFALVELRPVRASVSGLRCLICDVEGADLEAPAAAAIAVHETCAEEHGWLVPEAVWRFARVTEDTRAAGGAVGKILDGFEEVAAILRPRRPRR